MLIARRNAMMAGKRLPTARDYVQDGLVAMWDGIENAGWGVHNSTRSWVDLVGGKTFNFNSRVDVYDDHYHFNAEDIYDREKRRMDVSDLNVAWCEIVARITGPNATYNFGISIVKSSSPCIFSFRDRQSTPKLTFANCQYASAANVSYERIYQLSGGLGSTGGFYLDGKYVNGSGGWSGWDNRYWQNNYLMLFYYSSQPAYGDAYNIRLYSRALTAAEIAANYAIDKARFNLPDAT